jgi:hypothetical protein
MVYTDRKVETQHQEWLYLGQKSVHEQGLRRGVRTAAPDHVTTLMQDTFLAYYISAVNSCSDIYQLTHSTTHQISVHICVHLLTFQQPAHKQGAEPGDTRPEICAYTCKRRTRDAHLHSPSNKSLARPARAV